MTESRPWGAAKEKPKEEEGATYPCAQQHRGDAPRAPSASSPPPAVEAEFWACADAIRARWRKEAPYYVGARRQIPGGGVCV